MQEREREKETETERDFNFNERSDKRSSRELLSKNSIDPSSVPEI